MSSTETVVFRGQEWTVADARWDESGLEGGFGSHWHLTLTNPTTDHIGSSSDTPENPPQGQ